MTRKISKNFKNTYICRECNKKFKISECGENEKTFCSYSCKYRWWGRKGAEIQKIIRKKQLEKLCFIFLQLVEASKHRLGIISLFAKVLNYDVYHFSKKYKQFLRKQGLIEYECVCHNGHIWRTKKLDEKETVCPTCGNYPIRIKDKII